MAEIRPRWEGTNPMHLEVQKRTVCWQWCWLSGVFSRGWALSKTMFGLIYLPLLFYFPFMIHINILDILSRYVLSFHVFPGPSTPIAVCIEGLLPRLQREDWVPYLCLGESSWTAGRECWAHAGRPPLLPTVNSPRSQLNYRSGGVVMGMQAERGFAISHPRV